MATPDPIERDLARILAKRRPQGRPSATPRSDAARLVARACALYGVTKGELAELAGVGRSGLSRRKIPASTLTRLEEMVAQKEAAR